MTGGPWYKKYICKKLHWDLLEMKELIDIISCVLLMHMKKRINNVVMMAAAVGVAHYHQVQQQKHWFHLV